jgi:hypothetical protein
MRAIPTTEGNADQGSIHETREVPQVDGAESTPLNVGTTHGDRGIGTRASDTGRVANPERPSSDEALLRAVRLAPRAARKPSEAPDGAVATSSPPRGVAIASSLVTAADMGRLRNTGVAAGIGGYICSQTLSYNGCTIWPVVFTGMTVLPCL